jgi:hypothetical protein
MGTVSVHRFELFADYFQFYLQDDDTDVGNFSDSWTPETLESGVALATRGIAVGTARNTTVPVEVVVRDRPPPDDQGDLRAWGRITEAGLHLPSGRIVVAGCTDYFPDAARIEVAPGRYAARVYFAGLASVSQNRLEGDDHYRIVLWPDATNAPQARRVLKPFRPGLA